MIDTQQQGAAHHAPARYAAGVSTPNTQAARGHIAEITALEAKIEQEREGRDRAVVAMHVDDGLRAPDIARATGMSVSNVRAVLRILRHASR